MIVTDRYIVAANDTQSSRPFRTYNRTHNCYQGKARKVDLPCPNGLEDRIWIISQAAVFMLPRIVPMQF
jgi:hypothetical protein